MSRTVASRSSSDETLSTPASEGTLKTLLTADIRGYTRFTQEFGDERGAALAAKFAAVSREVVRSHAGELVELRGDEALAAFSSTRQALRAAVALQQRFAQETERQPELPLRVGIGIDAGEVVRVEEGYRGGALNLAARLSSLAGPSEILASDAAVYLARRIDGIVYAERGLVELKGFAEPIPVIRVLQAEDPLADQLTLLDDSSRRGTLTGLRTTPDTKGVQPPPGAGVRRINGARRVNGAGPRAGNGEHEDSLPIGGFLGALPEGPLVARDIEFDRILAAIQAVERSTGRLILLAGEPGVGKTRLAQEATLKARNHSFLMATGRCYEPEASVPFYPFLEALATLHAVAPAEVRRQLPAQWPEVQRLLPNQGSASAASLFEGQEEQQRLFWAVTGFLQAVAVQRPVAILLDDLHWADSSTLELLQHLARHTRAHRILLLGAYRDVEVNRQHPLEAALRDLGRERLVEEIEIRRLSQKGTAELVAAILGAVSGDEVDPGLVRVVHRQTEGNPFFIEEVVRALVERGDVYKHGEVWAGKSLAEIEVPKSVRSVVGQRLSRLPTESQEILREASVLGLTFRFDDLLHMCEREEAQVETALESAMSTGLVRETGRDTYAFNHALTQGTLYAELPSRRRRRLHLAAARSIEALPDADRQTRVAELAFHFLEADDPENALPYSLAAARSARAVFAFDEAERHYRTALELARELHDATHEARALEGLGAILRMVARYDEALEALEAALQIHHDAGYTAGERWTTAHIGRVHGLRGTRHEGIDKIRSYLSAQDAALHGGAGGAEEDGRGESPQAGLAALYAALAYLYQETDQVADQLEAAEKALELARAAGESEAGVRLQTEGQMWRASALAELGDLEDARLMLEDVIPRAEAAGDLLVLSRSLNTLADVYSQAGHYEEEQSYIERGLHAAEKMGDPTRVAFVNHRLGWHLLVRGRWTQARPYLECARAMQRSLGWTVTSGWTCLALAFLALHEGPVGEGEKLLDEARRLSIRPGQQTDLPGAMGGLLHWLTVDWLLIQGKHEAAQAYIDSIRPRPHPDEFDYLILLPMFAWIELEAGRISRSEELAHEATERATAERNRTVLVEALRIQAMVLWHEDCFEAAEQSFGESISTARAIEQPYSEARSLEAFGHMQAERGREPEAGELFEQAQDIYDRLGAATDRSRIESARAGLAAVTNHVGAFATG